MDIGIFTKTFVGTQVQRPGLCIGLLQARRSTGGNSRV